MKNFEFFYVAKIEGFSSPKDCRCAIMSRADFLEMSCYVVEMLYERLVEPSSYCCYYCSRCAIFFWVAEVSVFLCSSLPIPEA